jgi:hypothetical protein
MFARTSCNPFAPIAFLIFRQQQALGSHFLYANLAHAQTKADVFELLSTQFYLPAHFGKNWMRCMTA